MAFAGVKLTDRPGSQLEIAEAVLGDGSSPPDVTLMQPYFDYYISELELLHKGIAKETQQISSLVIRDYEDILYIVRILRNNVRSTRPHVRNLLRDKFTDAQEFHLNRSIDLALRVWLMINMQDEEFANLRHEATCVCWDEISTLQQAIAAFFPKTCWGHGINPTQFGPHFTAAFMHQVCGLKLIWTTSIHDHLRLDRRKNIVKIFPFKSHIEALLAQPPDQQPIPRCVLAETLQSLDLLFPMWDTNTRKLLAREKQTFHTTGSFSAMFSSRSMGLLDFDHWRDRLLELQEILQSPPVSWAQLWKDRRNPQQFWTFWIALIILVLTAGSFVTGVVQAWASVRTLNLALKTAAP